MSGKSLRRKTGRYLYRINGIETGRLSKQLQILERQKVHSVRLVNNDIRLTRVTLEHIEMSSGKSDDLEGFASADASASVPGTAESRDKPMFLYGERKVSRRVGKVRRIQSAMVKGRNTSAGLAASAIGDKPRPKSSIPTFQEIEERVSRQEEINPDWDPNTEPPEESPPRAGETTHPVIQNNWVFDSKPNTPAIKSRSKSGKKGSVSWQVAGKTSQEGKTEADEEEVITLIGKENQEIEQKKKSAKSTKKGRSLSAQVVKTSRNQVEPAPEEEDRKSDDGVPDTAKPTGKPKRGRASSAPKPRSPLEHPMAKVVNKTRALLGAVKKAQHSKTPSDPDQKELSSKLLEQKKRRAEILSKSRDCQAVLNGELEAKMAAYFDSNPAHEIAKVENPLEQYEIMRAVLKGKDNDALFDVKADDDVMG